MLCGSWSPSVGGRKHGGTREDSRNSVFEAFQSVEDEHDGFLALDIASMLD